MCLWIRKMIERWCCHFLNLLLLLWIYIDDVKCSNKFEQLTATIGKISKWLNVPFALARKEIIINNKNTEVRHNHFKIKCSHIIKKQQWWFVNGPSQNKPQHEHSATRICQWIIIAICHINPWTLKNNAHHLCVKWEALCSFFYWHRIGDTFINGFTYYYGLLAHFSSLWDIRARVYRRLQCT